VSRDQLLLTTHQHRFQDDMLLLLTVHKYIYVVSKHFHLIFHNTTDARFNSKIEEATTKEKIKINNNININK